ncbi:TraB/GumN family protein [Noviherbaspirillum aridicola]|uniref:TraB/GumN family protein n=1 Tax=Noviherbaspirillum aridicola TaxID=2849687 RepID=A0ABQ4Q1T1_9BURK|nr:TraB/GumN family protein [Noviherbaspirillum aridicola]GIZ50755.1 hypothetical protein NCCP691_07690 [Noviherbaspirillum aridicola]
MKRGIAVLLSVVAGLLWQPVAAGNDAAAAAATQAISAPPSSAPARGALYRIRHRGSTSYLFGTVHVGTPSLFPLAPEVTRALAEAGKLVLEIDTRQAAPFQAALDKHGVYQDGDDVSRHLSPATLSLLQRALSRAGLEWHAMRRFKPWLLANLLVGLDLEQGGYQRAHGAEMFLLSIAGTRTVHELESAEYQMSLFDAMDDATQEQYLREQLAELDDGKAMQKARALIGAWASGNGEALENIVRDSLRDGTLSSSFAYRVLLEKRNPEMAEKIVRMLESGESAFVGVGLLHLVGEAGLPALLKAHGMEVEKVH